MTQKAKEPKSNSVTKKSKTTLEKINFENSAIENKTENQNLFNSHTESAYNAAKLIMFLHKGEEISFEATLAKILLTNEKIKKGDFEHFEDILLNQINALNELFYFSIDKLMDASSLPEIQCNAEIVFKIQKNCRATVIALRNLKAPRQTTFVEQLNTAINQQINNLKTKKAEN